MAIKSQRWLIYRQLVHGHSHAFPAKLRTLIFIITSPHTKANQMAEADLHGTSIPPSVLESFCLTSSLPKEKEKADTPQ